MSDEQAQQAAVAGQGGPGEGCDEAAVPAGATSLPAVGEWIADAPAHVLGHSRPRSVVQRLEQLSQIAAIGLGI